MGARSALLWVTSTLLAGVAGCGLVAGLDDFVRGGQGGSSSSGVAGSGQGGVGGAGGQGGVYVSHCPDGTVEAPEIPSGWAGPYLVARASSENLLVDCPAGGAGGGNPELQLNAGPVGAPASCDCTCGVPQASKCTVTFTYYQQGMQCGTPPSGSDTVNNSCSPPLSVIGPRDATWVVDDVPTDICLPAGPTVDKGPPSWSDYLRLCPTAVEQVDELGCTTAPAAPFEERLCVVQSGEHGCPLGFGEVLYSDWIDERGCADDCSCSPGSVSCMGAKVHTYSAASCGGIQVEQPSSCSYMNGEVSAGYSINLASGSCTPVDATPTGEVVGTGPFTLCCPQPR